MGDANVEVNSFLTGQVPVGIEVVLSSILGRPHRKKRAGKSWNWTMQARGSGCVCLLNQSDSMFTGGSVRGQRWSVSDQHQRWGVS
jgi:hypothetical protein